MHSARATALVACVAAALAHAPLGAPHAHAHAALDALDVLPGFASAARLARTRLASSSSSSPSSSSAAVALAAAPLRLDSVTLLPGGRGFRALQNNIAWLRMFDVDRLLVCFRNTSGLPTNGALPYGGWEDPSWSLLRGHVTGGHFLSGVALVVNATGDAGLRSTLATVVAELARCQLANEPLFGAGYLSAFPPDQFDCIEGTGPPGCKTWSPYYTIHKVLAGLYASCSLAGVDQACDVGLGMLGYFARRIRAVIARGTLTAWWPVLANEFGGMNEVALQYFARTGDADSLFVGSAFNFPQWLGPLALRADILSGNHANQHLPIVVGAATTYELTGDARWADAAAGFLSVLRDGHTFATGGSSSQEHWGDAHRLGDEIDINNIESCTTYNVLKLSRALWSWSLDADALGFFERAKYSGMHGTQHPTLPGRVIYMLPTRGPNGQAGGSKRHQTWVGDWSDPLNAMWCCVGTAMESHSKHGDSLFFEQVGATTLLVALFDDASVAWPVPGGAAAGAVATVTQRPVFTATELTVTVTVSVAGGGGGGGGGVNFAVALRIPAWAVGASATLDGEPVAAEGAYFNISRAWGAAASNDTVVAVFPFTPVLEPLDDDRPQFANYRAVIAGPFALGALTFSDNVIVGADEASPAWVRPVSAAERAAAVSLNALAAAFPGGAANGFIMHAFNSSDVSVAAVELGGPPSTDPAPTYGAPQAGFLPSGNDVLSGVMTLAQALANCTAIVRCVAVSFAGPAPDPVAPTLIYLKSSAEGFAAAENWTTVVSSRWHSPFGGDEDGQDSTWVLEQPGLAGGASVSLRAFARPGEYLSCGAAPPARCSIAHDTAPPGSPASAAFNASASFSLHSPGLAGGAGSVSLESLAAPGAFASFFGGAPGGASPLSLQANQPGSGAFANASTFTPAPPNWLPPPVAFVAETANASAAGSRDLLLLPVADVVSEWYGVWLVVEPPAA